MCAPKLVRNILKVQTALFPKNNSQWFLDMIQIEKRMYATFLGQKKQQKDWLLVLNGSKISSLGLKCVFLYLKTTVDWIVPGILIDTKLVLFLIYSQCTVYGFEN